MMPFLFLKLFNIVNDKQTTGVLYITTFSSRKHFVSISMQQLLSQ